MILKATFISFLSGMATMLGVIPIFFLRKGISHRSYSAMLGLSGGIMLSATFFSLLLPAMEMKGVYFAISGFLTGVLFIDMVARYIPHEHFFKGKEGPDVNLKRIFLFMIAITIHNLPEGMSVGVGWALADRSKSIALATGIAIQNIPEGLAIALPLMALGYSIRYCIFMTFLSAVVEPIGGFIGISLVTLFNGFLPFALAFASGCMFFVISGEMIPESHERGYGRVATWCIVIGFAIMMLLDNSFK